MTDQPPDGYRVLARHERLRTPVFQVVTDELQMPDGVVVERDYLVHVGAVGVVALDEHERIVLVRQYRPAIGTHLWELPAGLIDSPGEDLVDAAARELAEEADLIAGRWDLLADVHTSPGCSNELIRLFLARELAPVPVEQRYSRVHEEAGLATHLVPLDAAVAMVRGGEITNAACIVGVLAAAHYRDAGWLPLRSPDTPLPVAER